MKYYVPVGPGGVFFRIGMAVTGMMGSLVYWRASRRRAAAQSDGDLFVRRSSQVGHSTAQTCAASRPGYGPVVQRWPRPTAMRRSIARPSPTGAPPCPRQSAAERGHRGDRPLTPLAGALHQPVTARDQQGPDDQCVDRDTDDEREAELSEGARAG